MDIKDKMKDPQAKATVDALLNHIKTIKLKAGKK
jgi:hypothetical protein